jgi:membrane protease YdiL (CAAX protease family)
MIEQPPEQQERNNRKFVRWHHGVQAQGWSASALKDNELTVERWRGEYQAHLARETDPRTMRQLGMLGTWPVVLVNLILLLVVEIILSLVLLVAAGAVIAVHDRDFSRGLTSNDAITAVLNSAKDWSLSPAGLAIGEFVTAAGILFVLYLRVIGPRFMTWADLGLGPVMRNRPLRACVVGIGLGVVALVLGDLVVYALHSIGLNTSGQEDTLKSVHHASLVTFLPFVLAAAVVAPIVEETFFRGYVFRAMSLR